MRLGPSSLSGCLATAAFGDFHVVAISFFAVKKFAFNFQPSQNKNCVIYQWGNYSKLEQTSFWTYYKSLSCLLSTLLMTDVRKAEKLRMLPYTAYPTSGADERKSCSKSKEQKVRKMKSFEITNQEFRAQGRKYQVLLNFTICCRKLAGTKL